MSTADKQRWVGVRGLLLGWSVLFAVSAGAQTAPALTSRVPADKVRAALPATTAVERLVVKFHEGSRVRLRGGRLTVLSQERSTREKAQLARVGLDVRRLEADVAMAQALLTRSALAAGGVSRLFREDEATLEERKRSGETAGGRELADLSLYFELPLRPGTTAADTAALTDSLTALAGVETAYAQPAPEPASVGFGLGASLRGLLAAADIPPVTPSFEAEQGYLNAAPAGIDARYAWTVPGGKGEGVRIVDVEGAWNTTHEDMPPLFHQGGTQINDLTWRNHGTAVLGVMVGAANGYGVRGIAHEASAGYESLGSQSTASAISNAATAVGRGDVVLIEVHAQHVPFRSCTCNETQCGYLPMEYWPAEFDAIATATANGVIVVEIGGNGSADLDDITLYDHLFDRATRDSGAIMVGASAGSSRAPTCWTNYGSRIDVHGWGESVTTMGYGDRFNPGDENQWYRSYFDGTSSASSVVVGAVASIQGALRACGRPVLSPQTMRQLLSQTGTPQSADSRRIGPLPDLRRALAAVLVGCPPPQSPGTWLPTGSLATARYGHSATLLSSGQVLVAGGFAPPQVYSSELYDPATGSWSQTTNVGLAKHKATLLPSGKVLAAGDMYSSNVALFDPATNTWAPVASMKTARDDSTATLLASGQVLLAGGFSDYNPGTAEIYEPVTGYWSPFISMNANRVAHVAALLPSGQVLVAGGNSPWQPIKTAEVYNPLTNVWSPTGAMASPRSWATATRLQSGKVLVVGGAGVPSNVIYATAELYDPATGTWSSAGSMAVGRFQHTATLLPSGKVLITGGLGKSSAPFATAELYDPANHSWSSAGLMSVGRARHTATLLPSGKVLVVGGTMDYADHSAATAEIYTPP